MNKILSSTFAKNIQNFLEEQGLSLYYKGEEKLDSNDYVELVKLFCYVAIGTCVEKSGQLCLSEIGSLSVSKEDKVVFNVSEQLQRLVSCCPDLFNPNLLLPLDVSSVVYMLRNKESEARKIVDVLEVDDDCES